MTDDLLFQFDLTWALADLHLLALVEADFLWEPASLCWTVRPDVDGTWRPDWADAEPDPVPVPTIAWITWHIEWWWSTAIDVLEGHAPPDRTDVAWPGTGGAAVARIRDLAARWRNILADMGTDRLAQASAFPWGPDSDQTVAHTALWLHVELMKNVAEIGQLRLLRAAAAVR
jgi:hypothetical protein